jgi:hypothetical protein
MNRTLLIAALWGILAWNVVGLAAFVIGTQAGVAGVLAGIAVAAAIGAARALRSRQTAPSNQPRVRARA